MHLWDALAPIVPLAERYAIITTMASAGDWPRGSDGPLVFHYVPSSMGQGPALGLGLALARPQQRVIVLNGDGCMTMNLGVLVTIGHLAPSNLAVLVMENGIYEVTGGQPHGGQGTVDFAGVARGCGIRSAFAFSDAAKWATEAGRVLTGTGPVFVRLGLEPRFGQPSPKPRRPMREQIERMQQALGLK